MEVNIKKLMEGALLLPVEGRAALAGSLLDSLDNTIDPNVESAWAVEIARRLHEIDSGEIKTVPWSEARRMILEQ